MYELVENDDCFTDQSRANEPLVDSLTRIFLAGHLSVRYDPVENAVAWGVVETLETPPYSGGKLSDIGAKLAQKGMLDEAIEVLEQAVRSSPKDAVARTNLGHAYHDKGLTEKAISNYKQALQLDPDTVDAYERLGTAYAEKGLFDKAIAYLKKALELNPTDSVASSNLGRSYIDKGLLDEAITQLLHATKLDPRNAYNHSTLGLAYFGKGLLDEAIAQMKLATQLEQPNWLYHSNLGDLYFEKNMWDESIEEYKRVIELGSESAAIYNNLGTAYAAKDLWREAIKEFERAIQMDPTLDLAQENFIIAQKNMVLAKSRKPSRAKKQESPSMFHKTKAYVQLDRLENELRSFIQQKMEQTFGKYWWKQRIPSDIQEKCWERKLKREAIPWQEVKKLHPIYYADFPHYLLIITRRDNWNRVFKSYFYSETWIKSKLEELNVIRTDISHTRTKMLTPRDARILEIYAEDILHSIQRSGPHREAESS